MVGGPQLTQFHWEYHGDRIHSLSNHKLRQQRKHASLFRMDPPKLGTGERKHVQHEIEKWKNTYEKESRTHREKGGEPGINTKEHRRKTGVGTGEVGPQENRLLVTKSMLSFRKGASEEMEHKPNCKIS